VALGIDWRVIAVAAAACATGFALVIRKAVGARSEVTAAGATALVGTVGEARGPLAPDGQVFVAGALWPAESLAGPIPSGRSVRVIAEDAGRLKVEPAAPPDRGL